MKVIGLTGNIGCGKSTVAGMLRDLGVAVIDLDAVARQIRNNDAEARRRIEARFGTIEAGELARVAFADVAALRELEAGGVESACIEAIKLLESPLHDACDQTWVVRCEEADAMARLAASRAMTAEDARRRLSNQSPQEEKVAAADVVIDGSATLTEMQRQVEAAYAALMDA